MRVCFLVIVWLGLLAPVLPAVLQAALPAVLQAALPAALPAVLPAIQGAALTLPIFKAGLPVVVAGITLTTLKIAAGVALLVKKKLLKKEEPTYHHQIYSAPTYGYKPPSHGYHKRSTQETWGEEMVELEKLLVSAASRLDTDGCVLKLLCHLNSKQAHARTLEENVLLQLFSSYPETLSSYRATFGNTAADVSKAQEQEAAATECDKVFPSCTLGQEELSILLQHSWPCSSATP